MSHFLTAFDPGEVAARVLLWLAQGLIYGSILGGLTWMGIRLLGARLRPGMAVVLWTIVLVKFVWPVGPASRFSLDSWRTSLATRAGGSAGAVDLGGWLGGSLLSDEDELPMGNTHPVPPAGGWRPWATGLGGVYALGVAGILATRLRRFRRFRARCWQLPEAPLALYPLLGALCQRLGIRRLPAVRVATDLPAPFVLGVFRPLLVLSARQLSRPAELETLMVHELAHFRRGDLLVRCLQWTAGTLWFFWPPVAWVNRRLDAARELACDYWALRHGRLTASEYARCLLEVVRWAGARRPVYAVASMATACTNIERRIDMVLTFAPLTSRRPGRILLAGALLVAWGAFTLAGAARAEEAKKVIKAKGEASATVEQAQKHVQFVVQRMAGYAGIDVDKDGDTSRPERTAFVIAVVQSMPERALAQYPVMDKNSDGKLDFHEVYGFVRGWFHLDKSERKAAEAMQNAEALPEPQRTEEMQLIKKEAGEAYWASMAEVFSAYEWLLDAMPQEPSAEDVAEVKEQVDQYEVELVAKLKQKIGEADAAGDAVTVRALKSKLGSLLPPKEEELKKVKEKKD
ncbi:MAG TPA: M56 family metallopeptidase [Phycisphaerae bacterium]|nr:M56 family metallopeptidase [Phycisphaerae bacterium]HNU44142.1 M56 family metallopeptidase [Phycisphaerae bacterium]